MELFELNFAAVAVEQLDVVFMELFDCQLVDCEVAAVGNGLSDTNIEDIVRTS